MMSRSTPSHYTNQISPNPYDFWQENQKPSYATIQAP